MVTLVSVVGSVDIGSLLGGCPSVIGANVLVTYDPHDHPPLQVDVDLIGFHGLFDSVPGGGLLDILPGPHGPATAAAPDSHAGGLSLDLDNTLLHLLPPSHHS